MLIFLALLSGDGTHRWMVTRVHMPLSVCVFLLLTNVKYLSSGTTVMLLLRPRSRATDKGWAMLVHVISTKFICPFLGLWKTGYALPRKSSRCVPTLGSGRFWSLKVMLLPGLVYRKDDVTPRTSVTCDTATVFLGLHS